MSIAAIWKFFTSPVGIAVLAAIAFGAFTYRVYQEGKENGAVEAIVEQTRRDQKIIEKSRDLRNDVERCRSSGGMWSRDKGTCEHP